MTVNGADDVLLVHGGTPLEGEIRVRGAKNLVPKAMVAALLGSAPSRLRNVPDIRDVRVVRGLLQLHGVTVRPGDEPGELVLDPTHVESANVADIDAHAGSSRIPILFCGPLLHRLGHAFIPGLGGCDIGGRPIDFHFDVLRQFGATIEKRADGQYLEAPQRLRGTKIRLPYPSVGATEQVLLTAVLAEGVTELSNAAVEPEIEDLICVLQKMGAIIAMDTDRTIRVTGVDRLGGYNHHALSDRLEAASWASAALATQGNIYVRGAQQRSMMTFLNTYRKVGGAFEIDDEGIRFWHPGGRLKSIALETDVHPGFQTDWQQPLVVALTQATGLSIVHETVYESRLGFTSALNQMGAHIQLYRECLGGSDCRFGQRNFLHSAVVSGPTELEGADLVIPDLRGGFSYLIAALAAQGTSRVHGIDLINRGYENFMEKLVELGAKVELPGKALG
ncbi:UDP-N-acetylglucosamine 1-carboxyvinyltransferase [Streptomyces griseoviridis]|jgi:UDP-N-acetylglucosamine 1-carboxyvinyltransferase|uniref:UDP-N-acetylglucosamine 1-carboxyvinyltransferase n=3 Tax=Streptomyces TaxID=1883 RepID=A0ABT9LEN2_STRGD|nr:MULTISPECIES: UDP-N-acetylglucosamine 1-carboxyvinyltransferase [Streptomyces]MDP9682093.1 UDP-N-acetylglucosamine 1-carboxyvinyltransferase [Streptomyces griseoviridis]GGS16285.1 UDP-N-acetylglucosamine 1-carboxyvinyltransferase [Streptomyces niveoruber]GGT02522.1 UDP-N-acetylglucosamine 1-carboxyvinyltransferase [Streptomyces griseoviridis]GGU34792.1 UDP-N-acetylglucosamine 1-carboxyvinyltransferase [Streptomyces daghestanicus]GHI33907.1 UDP-N-acetylglucosamine 1-carboxyvinyltransferase [